MWGLRKGDIRINPNVFGLINWKDGDRKDNGFFLKAPVD